MSKKKVSKKSKVKKITYEDKNQMSNDKEIEKDRKKVFRTDVQVEITLDLSEPLYIDCDTANHLVIGNPYLISRLQHFIRSSGDNIPDCEDFTYLVRHGDRDGIKFVENCQEELPYDKY